MPSCFVIQPFNPKYQKLYADVYRDAITEGGAEPYKVDDDAGASNLIEAIESKILESDLCFAEISEDNPNVWYELGFAMAAQKPFCVVCSSEMRERLPFDFRTRNVLFYDSESVSDFLGLKSKITTRVAAILSQGEAIRSLVKDVAATSSEKPNPDDDEMDEYKLVVLGLIAAEQVELNGHASIYGVKSAVERAGYKPLALALALQSFERTGIIETFDCSDESHGYESYRACRLTDLGFVKLRANEAQFELRKPLNNVAVQQRLDFSKDFDDEIPF